MSVRTVFQVLGGIGGVLFLALVITIFPFLPQAAFRWVFPIVYINRTTATVIEGSETFVGAAISECHITRTPTIDLGDLGGTSWPLQITTNGLTVPMSRGRFLYMGRNRDGACERTLDRWPVPELLRTLRLFPDWEVGIPERTNAIPRGGLFIFDDVSDPRSAISILRESGLRALGVTVRPLAITPASRDDLDRYRNTVPETPWLAPAVSSCKPHGAAGARCIDGDDQAWITYGVITVSFDSLEKVEGLAPWVRSIAGSNGIIAVPPEIVATMRRNELIKIAERKAAVPDWERGVFRESALLAMEVEFFVRSVHWPNSNRLRFCLTDASCVEADATSLGMIHGFADPSRRVVSVVQRGRVPQFYEQQRSRS